MPRLISLIKAIDWLLLCREALRIPRRIKGRVIIGMNKRGEGIILTIIERVVSARSLSIVSSIILTLLSWIHSRYCALLNDKVRSALTEFSLYNIRH